MAPLAVSDGSGTVASMDYVPLLLLAVVLVGAAVVAHYLSRLKRAAVQALVEVRRMEAQVQSLQAKVASAQAADADRPDGPNGEPEAAPGTGPEPQAPT